MAREGCWVDSFDGAVRYEAMLVQELIGFIDRRYRTRHERRFRGVAGFSMGGFGALTLAMRNPTLFAACAALSPGLSTDDELASTPTEVYDTYYAHLFGHDLEGEARLTAHWRRHAPLHLAAAGGLEELRSVAWYLDVGDDDPLYRASTLLHIALRDRGVPHEFRVRGGGHDWAYSQAALSDALAFMGGVFRRT